jgi:hypothetical protein
MIIRRDSLVHTPPTTQMMAATMSRGYTPPVVANSAPHITTATINQIASAQAQFQPQSQYQRQHQTLSPSLSPGSSVSSSVMNTPDMPIYTMNPLQQREAMQRETWEKERKKLLKKASNAQGDSVERLLANYLQV